MAALQGNPHSHRRRAPQGRQPGFPTSVLTRSDLSGYLAHRPRGQVEDPQYRAPLDTGVGAASARRFEKEAGDRGNVVVLRQLGLLQDTGDEDLQMLEWGFILDCRGLETGRVQAVAELDTPW